MTAGQRDLDIKSMPDCSASDACLRRPFPLPSGQRAAIAALLAIHACLLAWAAVRHTPVVDEIGHLPAGLSHWQFGRFDLYSVNPPLVRMVATLPLLWVEPHCDWSKYESYPGHRAEFAVGIDLFRNNGNWPFVICRWACIPFSLLGAIACYWWSRDLYGESAGLFSLSLWCFCPNILAHGQLITPDLGAAAVGVAANYAFWKWLNSPCLLRAVICGLMLGLTELTKFTWLVLFGLWPVLALLWWVRSRRRDAESRRLTQIILIISIGVYVIHLGYGFDGTLQRLDRLSFVSTTLGGAAPSGSSDSLPRNQFRETYLGSLRLPFPEQFVLGVDVQKRDFELRMMSYLRGEWRRGGWWWYYVYAMGVKTPVGMQVVFLLWLLSTLVRGIRRDDLVWAVPALTILVMVSSQTGINHHLRYVLPIFPLAFVGMSGIVSGGNHRLVKVAAWIGLAASCFASLQVYPHSLSFFNSWAGGPLGGPRHLLSSNIDWGQDLLYLRDWLDRHPNVSLSGLAYYGHAPPDVVGMTYPLPPRWSGRFDAHDRPGLKPGWYAVSVNALYDQTEEYSYFRRFRPITSAGYSIYIYRITPEDLDQLQATAETLYNLVPERDASR